MAGFKKGKEKVHSLITVRVGQVLPNILPVPVRMTGGYELPYSDERSCDLEVLGRFGDKIMAKCVSRETYCEVMVNEIVELIGYELW